MAARVDVSAGQVLSDIYKEIERLQDCMLNLTETLKRRRETVEKQCTECRALFKPWRVLPVECSDDEVVESSEIAEDTTPSSLDEKEKQELAMLDEILAKAHQARDIQDKISKLRKKSRPISKSSNENKPAQMVPSSHTQKARSKPKVSYPVLKRPSSTRSTYAESYTNPLRTKTHGRVTKKTNVTKSKIGSSQQEIKTQGDQIQTPDPQTHETKNFTENISRNTKPLPRNVTSSQVSQPVSHINSTPENSTETTPTSAKFLISEKGTSLSMPTEFLRISKEHKRLFRQVEKAKFSNQRESEKQFLKMAGKLFCTKLCTLSSISELHEEASKLTKDYCGLLNLAKMKALGMQSSSENGQLGQTLDDYGTITLKFQQLNCEAQNLKKNLDQLSTYCPLPEHKHAFAVVVKPDDIKYERKCVNSALGQGYTKPDCGRFYTYHNLKELRTFLKLSYDHNIMKYQLNLRRMVVESMLPMLQKLPKDHKSFIPLCRSAYSILCCEGNSFPTVVQDSLPED